MDQLILQLLLSMMGTGAINLGKDRKHARIFMRTAILDTDTARIPLTD